MLSEQKALKASIVLEALFGVSGLAMAFHTGSTILFMDGAYSTVCIFIMMTNVRVARLAALPATRLKPYGCAVLEPFSIIFQALLVLLICGGLIIVSCQRLLDGGHIPAYSGAAAYALFSVMAGIGITTVFYKLSIHQPSPILKVEFQEWLLDTALSTAALIAFVTGLCFGDQHRATPYLDPGMTLLITIVLVRFPLKTLLSNIRELMLSEPAIAAITNDIKQALEKTATASKIKIINLRMIKVGRWLWLDIEVDYSPGISLDALVHLQHQARYIVSQHCQHHRVQVLLSDNPSVSAQEIQNSHTSNYD